MQEFRMNYILVKWHLVFFCTLNQDPHIFTKSVYTFLVLFGIF